MASPVIAGSSPFTATAESVAQLAAAGAGAVVLKSIFEEQIAGEAASLQKYSDYPESDQYLRRYMEGDYVNRYTELIKELKSRLDIPVIASINCHTKGSWTQYARTIEQAGADALELNIFQQPVSAAQRGADMERHYLDIAAAVTEATEKIPISVKLAPYFTNPLSMAASLRDRGIKGVTLFNRMFTPRIDIHKEELAASEPLSCGPELHHTLRTVALCDATVHGIDISVSTGAHDADAIIQSLLAGAACVQICTALFLHGPSYITTMNREIENWMQTHRYQSVESFRGKMNASKITDSGMYYRTQYMRYFPNL